jgi:hypothetical protein
MRNENEKPFAGEAEVDRKMGCLIPRPISVPSYFLNVT